MKKNINQMTLRLLVATCCFSLVLVLSTLATAEVQQPQSLVTDEAVTPAGCTDTCCGGDTCDGGCCSTGCCKAVCCPKKVETEVKKHCWKVSTKQICIPGFTFKLNGLKCNFSRPRCNKPGCDELGCTDCCADTCCGGCADGCCGNDKCGSSCCDCPPKCGRVRCVKVLEKHEYTCDKCGYEWEVKCVRSNKGCSRERCGCPSCGAKTKGCCASTESAGTAVQLTSATEELPAEEVAKPEKKPSLTSRMLSLLKK